MEEIQQAGRKNLRILIVDDEPDIHTVLQPFFELEGYITASANNGVEALPLISTFCPHIVFLDIYMPEMDGIQCLRLIKDINKNIEVIIMTGYATTRIARKSLDIGAFDFIGKPFSFSHIREVLQLIKISKFEEFL